MQMAAFVRSGTVGFSDLIVMSPRRQPAVGLKSRRHIDADVPASPLQQQRIESD